MNELGTPEQLQAEQAKVAEQAVPNPEKPPVQTLDDLPVLASASGPIKPADSEPYFDESNATETEQSTVSRTGNFDNEPIFDESNAGEAPVSLAPWQKFIEKRREKPTGGADSQGTGTPDSQSATPSVADITTSAENENNSESVNINTMKEEALVDKLVQIKGIGEKTAMYLVAQIVELRGETVDKRGNTLPPVVFESAADFKANLLGIGTKKANEMAKFFNLPEIATEENPDTTEQEAADEADLNQRAESWQERAQRAMDAVKTGVFSIFQKTGKISADTLSQLASQTRSLRGAARRAADISHGVGAMESVMNMGISKMEKPWEYSESGDVDGEKQKERSLVKGFLEKLPKLKLSEKQKAMLRDTAAAGLAVGVSGLLTAGLLISLYSFRPAETTKIDQALTEHVLKMPVPAHNWMGEKLPPEVQAQLEAGAAQQVSQAEVLREPGVDRPSEPAADITQAQNTEDVLTALDAPTPPIGVVSPAIAPDAATAFNAPPMPDMGSTISPNEATAYKAPEVTNDAVAETGNDQPAEGTTPENQADASLGTAAAQSEVRLLMPTLGEKFAAPISETKAAEGVKKDGILYQQRETFVKENGLADDVQAWNAFVNLYVRFNPNTNWNAIIPGQTAFEEFNSLEELNQLVENGGNATLNPTKEVAVYKALQNPSSVQDENVREIAQELRDTTVNPTNMTAEELETFLGHFLDNKAEAPAN